jgi:hypothetical protein
MYETLSEEQLPHSEFEHVDNKQEHLQPLYLWV